MGSRHWISTMALALALSATAALAEELPVVLNGAYHEPVNAYRIGAAYFLNAKEVAALYGGQVYWYPVSGRVQLSMRGRAIQLQVGSDRLQIGSKMVALDSPIMLRTSQAYIPLSLFESEEFAAWAGMDAVFNPRTKLLTLDRRATIGTVRWFSYRDYTRLSLELAPRLGHSAAARGVNGVELSLPLGTIEGAEQGDIGDGLVDFFSLTQAAKSAKLTVKFSRPGLVWRVKELSNPRRVALDIFRAGASPEEDTASPTSTSPTPLGGLPARSAPESAKPYNVAPSTVSQRSPSSGPQITGKSERIKRKIVVDAGHGGRDPGATGARGTLEKDINLLAALELARLLREEGTFEVMLTRADDTFVPLADRSRLANEFGADLFVSLHCNAARHGRKNGFEVYFLSEKASDPEAERLAEFENSSLELEGKNPQDVQAEMLLQEMSKTEHINAASELAALAARSLGKRVDLADNGVKQAGFYVLRGTHAPAILFEMAYISNQRDEAKLGSKKFRRKLVDGLYAGILDYAKRQGWIALPQ